MIITCKYGARELRSVCAARLLWAWMQPPQEVRMPGPMSDAMPMDILRTPELLLVATLRLFARSA